MSTLTVYTPEQMTVMDACNECDIGVIAVGEVRYDGCWILGGWAFSHTPNLFLELLWRRLDAHRLWQPVAVRSTICPCGIDRRDCNYHK